MIKLLWAMDENRAIGKDNKLPWHIKEELEHFKNETINRDILMGRKTFESIKQPLKDRHTFVLTRNKNYHYNHDDVTVIYNIEDIIDKYHKSEINDIIICGGSQIYKDFWPYADELIVTYVKGVYDADTFFPKLDWSNFEIIKRKEFDKYTIVYYKRKER